LISWILNLLILSLIYSIVAMSMNTLLSQIGVFSMAYGALLGVASYTTALCLLSGLPYSLSILLAIIFSGIFGVIIIFTSFRFRSDYFIAVTLALQWIMSDIFVNANITGGSAGLYGIPLPSLFGVKINSPWAFLILSIIFFVISLYISIRIKKSNFGLVLRAIRDDEVATFSVGRNVYSFKSKVIIISSMLVGLAGAIYSTYFGVIEPQAFNLDASIFIAVIVIVGGLNNFVGNTIAAIILLSFPQLLMYFKVPSTIQGPLYELLYGFLLMVVVIIQVIKSPIKKLEIDNVKS